MAASNSKTAKRTRSAANRGYEDIKHEIATLRSDLEDLLSTAGDAGKNLGESSLADAREHLEAIGEALRDGAADARERVNETVAQRPVMSLAIAFGAGALLAGFLARR